MRTLENCGHIKIAVKNGIEKPQQANGKCAGLKEPTGEPMFACGRCKLYERK